VIVSGVCVPITSFTTAANGISVVSSSPVIIILEGADDIVFDNEDEDSDMSAWCTPTWWPTYVPTASYHYCTAGMRNNLFLIQ
jgi:hypothetical protein